MEEVFLAAAGVEASSNGSILDSFAASFNVALLGFPFFFRSTSCLGVADGVLCCC